MESWFRELGVLERASQVGHALEFNLVDVDQRQEDTRKWNPGTL
jgi:hypothetical protein